MIFYGGGGGIAAEYRLLRRTLRTGSSPSLFLTKKQKPTFAGELFLIGGGGGIRTLETRKGLLVFKTSAFSRSATPPRQSVISVATDK